MPAFQSWKLNSTSENRENYEKYKQLFAQKEVCFYCAVLNTTEPFYFMMEHVKDVHAT